MTNATETAAELRPFIRRDAVRSWSVYRPTTARDAVGNILLDRLATYTTKAGAASFVKRLPNGGRISVADDAAARVKSPADWRRLVLGYTALRGTVVDDVVAELVARPSCVWHAVAVVSGTLDRCLCAACAPSVGALFGGRS